jgi:hypothetical protein
MWTWISCYIIGHDYSITCQSGAIYLRCTNCGRRSQGWDLQREHALVAHDHERHPTPALAPMRQH